MQWNPPSSVFPVNEKRPVSAKMKSQDFCENHAVSLCFKSQKKVVDILLLIRPNVQLSNSTFRSVLCSFRKVRKLRSCADFFCYFRTCKFSAGKMTFHVLVFPG